METIEKYGIFECAVKGIQSSALTEGTATFRNGENVRQIRAFLTGEGEYKIRFMPEEEGLWDYQVSICGRGQEGSFRCVPNTGENHGKVMAEGDCFRYTDGET